MKAILVLEVLLNEETDKILPFTPPLLHYIILKTYSGSGREPDESVQELKVQFLLIISLCLHTMISYSTKTRTHFGRVYIFRQYLFIIQEKTDLQQK